MPSQDDAMNVEHISPAIFPITRHGERGIFFEDSCLPGEYVKHDALLFCAHGIYRFPQGKMEEASDLLEKALALAGSIDVLVLGTGKKVVIPPLEWRTFLQEKNIGIEMNDHKSAYRVYNILLSDNRQFAMLLLPDHE